MPRHNPVGAYDDAPARDGVAPYAGAALPGPVAIDASEASGPGLADSTPSWASAGTPVSSIIASFTLDDETYRIRHVEAKWGPAASEVRVPAEQAVAILSEAAARHEQNRELVHFLELAASQLVGLHQHGVYLLLRLEPQERPISPSASPLGPVSTPSSLKSPTLPELPPVADEPMLDAAQAMALKDAAALGVPFCEECARLAAQQAGAAT